MKRKKLLSLLLSVTMLVGSVPAVVLAQDNEDPDGDPEMADSGDNDAGEDPDDMDDEFDDENMDEDDYTVGSDPDRETIPESSVFVVGQMNAHDCLNYYFVPSTTGRYGVLCADGRDVSVTFADDDGYVAPMESERAYRYDVQYLNLQEGRMYDIYINADNYDTLPNEDVYCYICPMPDVIPYGESALFVKPQDSSMKYTFIPEESGQHVFEFTADYGVSVYIKKGNTEIPAFSSGKKTVADLEADVPYDISVYYSAPGKDLKYCFVNMNVSMDVPVLHTGENMVQLQENSKESFFVFTPEYDGYYVYEAKGEYDTEGTTRREGGYNYGEGKNFRTVMYMKAGETYYLRASQNSSNSVQVPIYIAPAATIQTGQEYSIEGEYGDKYYYTLTAEQSGWYYLDSGNTYHNLDVINTQNNYEADYEDAWYMTAGETYCIGYQYYGNNNETAVFSIEQIPSEASLESPFEVSTYSSRYRNYYMVYTPETNGVYSFTSERETSYFYVYDNKDKVITESVSGNLNKSTFLFSGTTYLIYFAASSAPQTPYVVTMQKQENAVSVDVDYDIDFPKNTKKQYSFTPETSGYYLFEAFGNFPNAPYVYDGSTSIYGINSYAEKEFQGRLVELEGGKSYRIQVSHSQSTTDGMYWRVHKVDALEPGKSIPVNAVFGYAYYTFTPEESGAYTFTSEMLSDANVYSSIRTKNLRWNNLEAICSLSDSKVKNGFSVILEKGKTYLFDLQLTTKVNVDSTMDVVKEQALVVDDENTVLITDRNSVHINEKNGICSFTPTEDGLYAFTSHSQTADPHIIVYDSNMKKIGEDDSSGDHWNFYLELSLEAGKTYYINIDEYDELELPVEVKQIEQMEAKLDGYSLSLDGTIAVNLYMTLNESVVKSNTAVLQYTRADGTVVSYGMDKAQKRELNGKTYYVFHLPVAAKEMTAELKAQIVDPDNAFEGKKYTFTVQEYAQYIIDHAYYNDTENQAFIDALPLVKALLNYGTAAQNYFGFNVSEPANKTLYGEQTLGSVPTSRLPAYDASTEVLPEGVTFDGASLSIESETELVFYFSNPNGVKLSFSDGSGKALTPEKKGEYTTIRVKGIPAHKLGERITLKIAVEGDATDYQVAYIPMTYCYNVLTRPLTETRTKELKDLMKAFYFFNQAAVSYMAEKAEN